MARLNQPAPARRRAGALLIALLVAVAALVGRDVGPAVAGIDRTEVRILAGEPNTFDPTQQSDATTASILAQIHETLTAYDSALQLQPALAASWDVADDGTSVTFHLREGLTFSDGTPLDADDVVGSWLRLIDPQRPSPLVSLMVDVRGARDYLAGRISDPAQVGLRADGLDVEVELERPGADFPAIVSAPIFAIVPPAVWQDGQERFGIGEVVSGAYLVEAITPDELTLARNDRYWAGPPPIPTVRLIFDIGGRSAVAAFEAGDLDYTQVPTADASWLPYDEELGPQLRATPSLSLTYMGIDTTRPPFDDVRVRQALGAAIDWERVVSLGLLAGEQRAISMVPPAIPGGGDGDWLPVHDPERARQLLAEAGYPGGEGLPRIEFAAGFLQVAEAIVADLDRELGMQVELVILDDHLGRIDEDPPSLWIQGWVADYVGANDFLGVLLETGSSNNDGEWSSAAFDQAIAEALATRDPAAAEAAYERALAEIQREVPVVPLSLSTEYALSREGLLGAWGNGLGIMRMAGMQWAP